MGQIRQRTNKVIAYSWFRLLNDHATGAIAISASSASTDVTSGAKSARYSPRTVFAVFFGIRFGLLKRNFVISHFCFQLLFFARQTLDLFKPCNFIATEHVLLANAAQPVPLRISCIERHAPLKLLVSCHGSDIFITDGHFFVIFFRAR
ncbi:MAG TPA: hypothetical protein DIS93_11605 [Bdellovibrionales bacterium]|nr:hypothetical protein [Bdellovibrionales bacterium]